MSTRNGDAAGKNGKRSLSAAVPQPRRNHAASSPPSLPPRIPVPAPPAPRRYGQPHSLAHSPSSCGRVAGKRLYFFTLLLRNSGKTNVSGTQCLAKFQRNVNVQYLTKVGTRHTWVASAWKNAQKARSPAGVVLPIGSGGVRGFFGLQRVVVCGTKSKLAQSLSLPFAPFSGKRPARPCPASGGNLRLYGGLLA